MLALKYLLTFLGLGLFSIATALVAYDIYVAQRLRSLIRRKAVEDAAANPGARLLSPACRLPLRR